MFLRLFINSECFTQSTSPSRQRTKEDIPQEQVARLYQEELSKIMGKRLEDSMRSGEQPFAGYVKLYYYFNVKKKKKIKTVYLKYEFKINLILS